MEHLEALGLPRALLSFGDGSAWLLIGAVLAGIVRGFSGFGTAMVFLPFASAVISPIWALVVLCIMDIVGPAFMAPRMARDANLAELGRLTAGAAVAMPLGLALLGMLSQDFFRIAVSLLALSLVAVMASGWRYRGKSSNLAVFGIGGASGFLAGSTGVPGPPVMLFYLARPLPPAAIRANIFIFLLLADVLLLAMLAFRGWLTAAPVYVGIAAAVVYFIGLGIGTQFFRPDRDGEYRTAAYAIIAASALLGLLNLFG